MGRSRISIPEYQPSKKTGVESTVAEAVCLESDSAVDEYGESEYGRMMKAARSLEAATPYVPATSLEQRGRRAQLKEFNAPHNLTIGKFAELGAESVSRLYRDIRARRLLVVDLGPRGKRVPAWQLAPSARALTQALLGRIGNNIDA